MLLETNLAGIMEDTLCHHLSIRASGTDEIGSDDFLYQMLREVGFSENDASNIIEIVEKTGVQQFHPKYLKSLLQKLILCCAHTTKGI